jgi:tRNA 2-selenouridine synthase
VSLRTISAEQALTGLAQFSAVIDARSESEYAHDRLPGAINWPSLHDDERVRVGTLYKQVSPFEARKLGAALVARNIASHIELECLDKLKNWQPLVYCWRGGHRSGALSLVLAQIGFKVTLIEGGYKAFRNAMRAEFPALAQRLHYRVVCGPTGSGKTRLLHALHDAGAQVLDLEQLASHRASVLGVIPGQPQPSQKHFEMRVWQTLREFDAAQPVYVEAESKKVGNVTVPDALIDAMRASPCLRVELADDERVALLMEDYPFFVNDPEFFCQRLDTLVALRGRELVGQWQAQARAGHMSAVVRDLLTAHYDPGYAESTRRHFVQSDRADAITLVDRSAASMAQAAQRIAATPEPAKTGG